VKEKHIIPYGAIAQSVKLVAVKDGFAEVIDVNIPAEEYKLSISYIYH
jgi:hypothetical protein